MATTFSKEAMKRLKYWITEREKIRINKENGCPQPWSKDPIITKYRFCSVRRNDDRVTRWVHANWLEPSSGDAHLWFAMVVARLVNWPDTLADLSPAVFNLMQRSRKKHRDHDVAWDPALFVHYMHARKADGHKVFSGAYIVSTNGHKMDKAEYLAAKVLTPLWEARNLVAPSPGDTLNNFHARLQEFDGMGSFMAAQVVADIKYDPRGALWQCADWHSWAAPGPGSLRGMARLIHGDCEPGGNYRISGKEWQRLFSCELWPVARDWLNPAITGQDLQNCLCEFDKFERVRLGQGTPRSLYRSHA